MTQSTHQDILFCIPCLSKYKERPWSGKYCSTSDFFNNIDFIRSDTDHSTISFIPKLRDYPDFSLNLLTWIHIRIKDPNLYDMIYSAERIKARFLRMIPIHQGVLNDIERGGYNPPDFSDEPVEYFKFTSDSFVASYKPFRDCDIAISAFDKNCIKFYFTYSVLDLKG